MRYFPAFVDVADAAVVVVGGGEKAAQKLRLLVKTEARIKVVAPMPSAEITALAQEHGFTLIRQEFSDNLLDGARLVFAADDLVERDLAVADAARRRGIAVNVVDRPAESTFIVPALVDRDPVMVAIGTEGTAPILGREIKSRIESWLPAHFGDVAREASRLRDRIGDLVRDPIIRRKTWERLLFGAWRQRVLDGQAAEAEAEVETALTASRDGSIAMGRVSLVGAGPGDADLLTLKAQQRMQQADVLVIDGLVTPEILEYARRDAKRIDVSKKGYGPAVSQDEINRILVREASKGQHVVRLKGGDPFIFGRAAEELSALQAAGIDVEVVPGITAAHACAARIGLPVTLRQKVRQFSVIAGATNDGLPELDWPLLARPGHASALYMGVRTAPTFQARLRAAGARGDLPVVIVENGTRRDERAIATTLDLMAEAVEAKGIKGPAVIFIGLDWADAHLREPEHLERYRGRMAQTAVAARRSVGVPERTERQPASPRAPSARPSRKWTPEEIANATFWVAG